MTSVDLAEDEEICAACGEVHSVGVVVDGKNYCMNCAPDFKEAS